MIWLLALATLIPVATAARHALRPGGVEINHVVIFSFGFLFYWILPVAAGALGLFADEPALALWYRTYDSAARSGGFPAFVVAAVVSYVAFLGGDRLGSRMRLQSERPNRLRLLHDPRLLRLFLLPAILIAAAYGWRLRGELFTGYQTVYEADTTRGTFTAANVLLLALCLLRWAEADYWGADARGWWKVLTDPFVVAYAISALLVLSLGGRLYIVSAMLMALTYRSVFRRPLPLLPALAVPVIGALVAGAVGSLRLGYAPSPMAVAVNVLLEPLFTSFSLLHHIAQDHVPFLAAPRFLVSDFVNLVPTAVLPIKAQLLLDPADYGHQVFSPGGALNSYFSFTINFGSAGMVPVMFLIGWGMAVLKRRTTPHLRVRYCMLSGWLAFTFFRDAFSISLVKNMFQFSILVPLLIVGACHVMTVAAPRRAVAA
jgi:hypothetical protein